MASPTGRKIVRRSNLTSGGGRDSAMSTIAGQVQDRLALAPAPVPLKAARLLVSLATYNERDNLPKLIDEIHAVVPQAEVLVIDDNSPDGTGRVAEQRASADARIKVLHRPGKLGLGTAILAGMRYAIDRDY